MKPETAPSGAVSFEATLLPRGSLAGSSNGKTRDARSCSDVMLSLGHNLSLSGLFHLGSGRARSWCDLTRAMFGATGTPCAIEFMDMPAEMSASYQNNTQADLTKLRAAGYDWSFASLQDEVFDYIANYLSKDDIYR